MVRGESTRVNTHAQDFILYWKLTSGKVRSALKDCNTSKGYLAGPCQKLDNGLHGPFCLIQQGILYSWYFPAAFVKQFTE